MSLTNTHPQYDDSIKDIALMRLLYSGSRKVKEQKTLLLPATPSMIEDGMNKDERGYNTYEIYLHRARFPEFVKDALVNMLGIMHRQKPNIIVPDQMLPLLENITDKGESVYALLRNINTEQLLTGRAGLMMDFREGVNPLPYVCLYPGETIRNWHTTNGVLDVLVLHQPELIMNPDSLLWDEIDKYKYCALQDGRFVTGVFEDNVSESELVTPALGTNTLTEIPFRFINATDTQADIDAPPLLTLGNLVLGIYQSEADYRFQLYMQSQDTLVRIGHSPRGDEESTVRVGVGAVLDIDIGGDAKYIGVSEAGISEAREALKGDKEEAMHKAIQLIPDKKAVESNASMKTRMSAKTVSLVEIAQTSAEALEDMLKLMATVMGLNPDNVSVEPFTEFGDTIANAQDLKEYMMAKTMGAPISLDTIHNNMRKSGMTSKTLEEELQLIESEGGSIEVV